MIVQAWDPELRPVVLAARHAVAEFLDGELERRRQGVVSVPANVHGARLTYQR